MTVVWGGINQNVVVGVNFVNNIEGFSCNESGLGFNIEHIIIQEEYAESRMHSCMFNKKNIQGGCYFDR